MPTPLPDTPEDKALWARAEQIAEELIDLHDRAVASAIDDAFDHKTSLAAGKAGDSDVSERLFAEAQADLAAAQLLAERIWIVLHAGLR